MFDHTDLHSRILTDLMDGYDEELEMEIEDRHVDELVGDISPEELLQQKESRRVYFRELFRLQAELDLHGLNRDGARSEVALFLAHCQSHSYRCVRIIHGKGNGSPN